MWRRLNRGVMLIKKGNIEVSIGKAVGHVFEDLLISAKRRLWVVSPWISPEYADLILKKKAEGVDVQVITTNDYRNTKHRETLRRLMETKTEINQGSLRGKVIALVLGVFAVLLIALNPTAVTGGIAFLILICAGVVGWLSLTKSRIYWASAIGDENEKLIVCDKLSRFTHSKIYIIDDTGAVGSANLTRSGLWNNLETLVIMRDKNTVNQPARIFHNVKDNPLIQKVAIEEIAASVFAKKR